MKIFDLFEEIYSNIIMGWHEELEKADELGYGETEKQVKIQLDEKLDEKTKKLLKIYGASIENKLDYIYCEICRNLFLFSVKTGMDMQKAFDEES